MNTTIKQYNLITEDKNGNRHKLLIETNNIQKQIGE
jgi:hypothetical protein